jgi:hypothetical protein
MVWATTRVPPRNNSLEGCPHVLQGWEIFCEPKSNALSTVKDLSHKQIRRGSNPQPFWVNYSRISSLAHFIKFRRDYVCSRMLWV